ncbi:MAG: C45 family autoproteolytic acyltransferase/hydrolase [Parachlamydiaceae bacterium]
MIQRVCEGTNRLIAHHTKPLLISTIALTAIACASAFLSAPISVTLTATLLAGAALGILSYRYRHVFNYLILAPILDAAGLKITGNSSLKEFEEREFKGHSLKYIDGQPVLTLNTSDPEEMGEAQGYLLGDAIEKLIFDVLKPMIFTSSLLVGDFSGKQLKEGLEKVSIPDAYDKELKAMAKGYKKFCEEKGIAFYDFTNDLHVAHKFADVYKAIGAQRLFGIRMFSAVGCTTVVQKINNSMFVSRTLDWPTFGKGGSQMLLRKHKIASGEEVVTHTMPGVIHALTGKRRLEVIINELGTASRSGTPYGLIARKVVEECNTLEEARKFLEKELPASSCHLTVVDHESKSASNFQFHVSDKPFIERSIEKHNPLIVTNHAIDDNGAAISGTIADGSSHKRFKKVQDALKDAPLDKLNRVCSLAACVFDTVGVVNSENGVWKDVVGSNFSASKQLAI